MGLPRLRASAVTLLVDALHALVYIPFVSLCKSMPLYLYAHDPLPGRWDEWFEIADDSDIGMYSLQTPENATLIDRGDDLDVLYSRHIGEEVCR